MAVLYLGLDAGGYAPTAFGPVGVVLWWVIGLGLLLGLLPLGRIGRSGLLATGLLLALAAWTLLSVIWTDTAAGTMVEVGRTVTYAGLLCLGLLLRRDAGALRAVIGAVTSALTLLALVGLASRLLPALFPASAGAVLMGPGDPARLSYPLGYWNALAAAGVMALPLLAVYAGGSERRLIRVLATAALPAVTLTIGLTVSRAGVLFGFVAVLVLLGLSQERTKVVTALVIGLASGVAMVVVALGMPALMGGGQSAGAQAAGLTLLLIGALLSAVAVLVHEWARRLLSGWRPPSPQIPGRAFVAVAAAILLIAVLAFGLPSKALDAWEHFKDPNLSLAEGAAPDARLTALSGNGRYQFWQAAISQGASRPLIGHGAGSFEGWWLRTRPFNSFVRAAHSAYLQAFGELGMVGALLLLAFVVVVLVGALRRTLALAGPDRSRAAAAVSAAMVFALWSGVDWVWQVPALAAAFLLLVAVLLGPPGPATGVPSTPRRACAALGSLAALVLVALPLASASSLQASQASAAAGDLAAALRQAQYATVLEPWSAPAALQESLVQERRGELVAALLAVHRAVELEPLGWQGWLVLGRLETETGDQLAGRSALAKAERLNPLSPVFEAP
ncbi:MAG: hypothetical protein QOG62_2385 [Thermoleophilaceae bacterium]|nr:hypothetical protein [Thermoleophilaceae bacterium]